MSAYPDAAATLRSRTVERAELPVSGRAEGVGAGVGVGVGLGAGVGTLTFTTALLQPLWLSSLSTLSPV